MHGVNRPPFIGTIEITLDLPMPPSVNQLWRVGRGRVHKSKKYLAWLEEADMSVMAAKAYPKLKIQKYFEAQILLNCNTGGLDGDNHIKAILDWAQSREIIRNDADCVRGSWAWVEPDQAPRGCRVVLRSLMKRPLSCGACR